MNRTHILILLLASCLMSACVQNPRESLSTATLYRNCQLCHSHQELQRGPIIDGLDDYYVLGQLKKFKHGQRGQNMDHKPEALMGSAVDALEKKDIKRIARYIAAIDSRPYQPSVKGNVSRGQDIFKRRCASCHGDQAEGRRLMKTGSLAVLEDWYMLTQLRHFKHGRRGIHPDDKEGRLMAEQVASMSDPDFLDVANYISATFGNLRKADLSHSVQNQFRK